jgi:hypothetical protein
MMHLTTTLSTSAVIIAVASATTTADGQSPPAVDSVAVSRNLLDYPVITHTFTQTGGTPPIVWDDFMYIGDMSNRAQYPATFDPETQLFRWDTLGGRREVYVWSVRATNGAGSSIGTLTINTFVPEPATALMVAFGLLFFSAFTRRR